MEAIVVTIVRAFASIVSYMSGILERELSEVLGGLLDAGLNAC